MPEYYIYIPKVPNLEKTIQELINLAIDKLINKDQEKLVVEYSGVQLNLLDISLVIIKTDNMTGGTQLFLENKLNKKTKFATFTLNKDAVQRLKDSTYRFEYIL